MLRLCVRMARSQLYWTVLCYFYTNGNLKWQSAPIRFTCGQACGGIFMINGWFGKVWCTAHDAQPWVGGPGHYKKAEESSKPWGISQLSSMENKSMATTLVPSSRFSLPSLSALNDGLWNGSERNPFFPKNLWRRLTLKFEVYYVCKW